ncbi:tRNA (adenosine(37)-N6)-threonylcarbamoyltransferase complex dimerization subunit type 1 TsaB [Psychroflexus sp. CAK57W]|uniref:tRNA (adenosine(37)-N6)-threonylcarbamoyltransferase complex dimerization subunit type 1 TsaB n=1 Tax=Psychroflexus curvus TaxID=2873595 RepID=UPI001CCF24CE|nr:tRNA (adenosine(37)-N6)-threonylcarbamoyltransferase complex dimerization subunit type 1 TsaB [Psychroflexus curvus]MBZ9627004.1 tRNA (adenosine(37)-N6)-threonylcarbamoyltransferase complex dimerization subunit type 1 TsaB [Psychroflexus curvus]MBZ9787008.1 tRNA (adenosine(37)-N6)-threonylcarbamoyltransferase complex dimerization subunit type 1 TsaB [Psychroflexus curvus]
MSNIILCLETSTTNCSVCIGRGSSILTSKEINSENFSHSEQLHGFIIELLTQKKLTPKDVDAVSISKGPGSYTGLRIGVSAAKGLAFALDIPLISVSTLLCLAKQINIKEGLIVPMLDARRMEVYSEVLDADFTSKREIKAEILDEHSFQKELKLGKVHFIGSGVEKFEGICNHPNAVFHHKKLPSAQEQFFIAKRKYDEKIFEDVAYFEPFYLKDFVSK